MDTEYPAPGVIYLKHPLGDIWTGVTLVETSGELLIVDTATAAAVTETIMPSVPPQQLNTLIVNTHCHCDHIGGNAALVQRTGAQIAAHAADSAYITDRAAQFEGLFSGYGGSEFAMNRAGFMALAGADCPVNRILQDGDELDLGDWHFRVCHAPGHSDGSIVLFDAASGLLLAGDAPQCAGTTDTGVPLLTDIPAYRRTLATLRALGAKILVLDHAFQPFENAIFYGEAVSAYFDECVTQLDRFQTLADEFIAAHPAGLTVRQLAARLAQGAGLPAPNVYACLLAQAFLEQQARPSNPHDPIPDHHYTPISGEF